MNKLTIACIIPSTCSERALPHLKRCLDSLHQAAKGVVELRLVITTANTAVLKQRFKNVDYVSVEMDTGFSALNNSAIEHTISSASDHYLFLNDDAWVKKDFFQKLVQLLKKQKLDVINPLIYSSKRMNIDSYGIEYFISGYAKNARTKNIQTSLATAACMLVKSSFLQKMKREYGFYFNEILHFYLEDVEFSIRAAAIGGKIAKSEQLIAYHIGSASSGEKSRFVMYQTYRNVLWVIILTWPKAVILKHLLSIGLVQAWMCLYSTYRFGPGFYLRLSISTVLHGKKLLAGRHQIVSVYHEAFNFEELFAPYIFRTRNGKVITI